VGSSPSLALRVSTIRAEPAEWHARPGQPGSLGSPAPKRGSTKGARHRPVFALAWDCLLFQHRENASPPFCCCRAAGGSESRRLPACVYPEKHGRISAPRLMARPAPHQRPPGSLVLKL